MTRVRGNVLTGAPAAPVLLSAYRADLITLLLQHLGSDTDLNRVVPDFDASGLASLKSASGVIAAAMDKLDGD